VIDLRRCREILGSDCSLTDEQLELLRDQLAGLADIALEVARGLNGATSVFDTVFSLVTEAQYQEIAERASIMEFEGGGLHRAQAEKAALNDFARIQTKGEPIN
jgi:hypothetical protein